MRGRSYDRFVALSDGIVAVAATIMVLPVTEIDGPGPGSTMLDVVAANAPLLSAYVTTFLVVGVLWRAHHRVLEGLDAYDGTLFWLNLAWLATIALLPWPIAILARDPQGSGVPAVYLALAAGNSLALWLLQRHAARTPALWAEGVTSVRVSARGLAFACVFAAGAIAASIEPQLAWAVIPAFAITAVAVRVRGPEDGRRARADAQASSRR